WWLLSISNAASMFDISGTIWFVSLLFVYGLKSAFIPWLWPVFNQVFLMVYLSAWLRRSGVMTGAEWITLRFGRTIGADISRLSVVLFALASVIGFTGYAFIGIAKFSAVFLPDTISPNTYALIIVGVTTLYTVVGGLYSVVLTDLIQFAIMAICSVALALIAMQQVAPEALASATPDGWGELWFGWQLDLDWSTLLPAADSKIQNDGYTMFGAFVLMMVFKGVLVSIAGPAPNYDMQRILATKNSQEAALMSCLVTPIQFIPRFLMITAITVLALGHLGTDVVRGAEMDMEQILPIVIRDFVPVGLTGLLIAGLLAAFMSTFAGTINAAAAYLVNDLYKHYCDPSASDRKLVRVSYASSLAVVIAGCAAGYFTPSVGAATEWIVAALWGGYAAPNVLKWHWWRLNGHGYFWGMTAGIVGSVTLLWFPNVEPLYAFPYLLAFSTIGTILGSLLTEPTDEEVLVEFYRRTRPWGFWAPIHAATVKQDPDFEANHEFNRNMFNVLIGIAWQMTIMILPIYIVIQDWKSACVTLAALVGTSLVLKVSWYDRLSSTTS
ncbi:MAG: sodium:solute symporter family protein, partial [Planctomycetota bacterium]